MTWVDPQPYAAASPIPAASTPRSTTASTEATSPHTSGDASKACGHGSSTFLTSDVSGFDLFRIAQFQEAPRRHGAGQVDPGLPRPLSCMTMWRCDHGARLCPGDCRRTGVRRGAVRERGGFRRGRACLLRNQSAGFRTPKRLQNVTSRARHSPRPETNSPPARPSRERAFPWGRFSREIVSGGALWVPYRPNLKGINI